jgi:hypothetical protein
MSWASLAGRGEKLCANEIPVPYRNTVNKGLDWLAKAQNREGHWAASGGRFHVALTGLSGMAFLMEGSTVKEGKYADNVRRATDWLMKCPQPNGYINPFGRAGQGYMHGHGYALLFLAQIYGEEENSKRRKRLEEILTQGVNYLDKAQSPRGGWGYFSNVDEGGQWDETSVTVVQVQALRACRNVGIAVPKGMIDKARKYYTNCTTDQGGVRYGPMSTAGHALPSLTAAAIASAFSAGDYHSPMVKEWFRYCRTAVPSPGTDPKGYNEFTHYYWAQCVYMLGDDGWAKLFRESRPGVTWSSYRQDTFDFLCKTQRDDGSWSGSPSYSHIGPIYATATALTILQLDKATLPIYQR